MVVDYGKLIRLKEEMDMINIKNQLNGKMFLSPQETSEFLEKLGISICVRNLYRMVVENKGIKSVKIAGKRLFPVENILAFVLSECKK